ncbi:MAG: hypothetical protein P0S95_03735 [Rhabdochlamydiaceae bacterium]|nr:hypothetical protein [Candidatus Amphrikana amoebophyrae]
MRKSIYLFFLSFLLCFSLSARQKLPPKNVGLCITATGKYINFVPQLVESARKYFLKDHNVTFFVFTDSPISGPNIVMVPQKKLDWPYATMMRFEFYHKNSHLFDGFDYMFALDADMLFVSKVKREILSDRVATMHPGYAIKRAGVIRGDFETSEKSLAYMPSDKGEYYFAGGFYGGSKDEFIKINKICSQNIRIDLQNGIIAKWHDESHLNRYFAFNFPTKILSPSYCYTSSEEKAKAWHIHGRFRPRLLALEKDHSAYQK